MRDLPVGVPSDLFGPEGEFGHREHVRLAWTELRAGDPAEALERIERIIRHVAAAHGQPDKYHRTITEGWATLVAHHLREAPELTFDEFCVRFPGLLDPTLLGRHYSRELLAGPAARTRLVDPDLRPLPAL
jgi:hypothetical protein